MSALPAFILRGPDMRAQSTKCQDVQRKQVDYKHRSNLDSSEHIVFLRAPCSPSVSMSRPT